MFYFVCFWQLSFEQAPETRYAQNRTNAPFLREQRDLACLAQLCPFANETVVAGWLDRIQRPRIIELSKT